MFGLLAAALGAAFATDGGGGLESSHAKGGVNSVSGSGRGASVSSVEYRYSKPSLSDGSLSDVVSSYGLHAETLMNEASRSMTEGGFVLFWILHLQSSFGLVILLFCLFVCLFVGLGWAGLDRLLISQHLRIGLDGSIQG